MKNRYAIFGLIVALSSLTCRGPEGPQGPAGPNIEALTDPDILPVVIATYPPANTQGPYEDFSTNQIQIRFNKIMDRTTVKRALRLTSSRRPIMIDTNSIHSVGGDLFTFTPVDTFGNPITLWKIRERDTIRIETSARDINGNNLQNIFTATILPEPAFRIMSVTPPNNAVSVPADTVIRVRFNGAVGSYVGDFMNISPPVSGRWYFVDPINDKTQIYFLPNSTFVTNTTYTLTVNGLVMDLEGFQLGNNYVSTFSTGSFRIMRVNPGEGSENVSLFRNISVSLTAPVDTGTIRRSFSIYPPTPGTLSIFFGNSIFSFNPTPELLPDTVYTLRVDSSIRSMFGESIGDPFEFTFRTAKMRVAQTSPYHNQVGVPRFLYRIEVYFNAYIDTGSVRPAFNIPGITGNFALFDGANYFYFYPNNTPLPDNTTFLANVGLGIRSLGGTQLGEQYTFAFTTGN